MMYKSPVCRLSRLCVLIFSIILVLTCAMLAGCGTQSESTAPESTASDESTPDSSTGPAVTTTASNSEPSQTEPAIPDLTTLDNVFIEPDFGGVVVSTEFFWSPGARYCLFQGHRKDAQQQFVPGAYLYDVDSDHLVKLLEGQAGDNYYLAEPVWSPDEAKVTVPFYAFTETDYRLLLYDLTENKMQDLKVSGMLPAFSPDGRLLAFTHDDGSVSFYDFSLNQTVSPNSSIQGFSPIWFSDHQRLLYVASTGNNPSNLEYGWLSEVRLVDINQPAAGQTVMPESSYHRVRWLTRDKLALVESGMDDGFFSAILNVDTFAVTDLGETRLTLYRSWDQALNLVIRDYENELFRKLDQNLNETSVYQATPDGSFVAISHLPDDRLLCLDKVSARNESYLAILLSGDASARKIAYYPGDLQAITASDGTRAAFFDQNSSRFFILKTVDFYQIIG